MKTALRSFGGAALAAAARFWFDPVSGRRRRARLRDQLVSASGDLRTAIEIGGRDVAHRLRGTMAAARSAYNGGRVSDYVLAERVRTALGRAVSHPGAIEVTASSGRVTLRGDLLADEFRQLMRVVRATHGVVAVEDKLSIHEDSRGVSALQGGRPRRPQRFHFLREYWSPAARLVGGAVGGTIAAWGLYRRGTLGVVGAAAGSALLIRSGANVPLERWFGLSGPNGVAIDIRKTIRVNAPVDEVFQILAAYENYPRFMRNVRSVRRQPDGSTRWCIAGPAGIALEWEAFTTRFETNRLLAWRTAASAPIQHSGVMRFEPANGGTRVDIRMSYCPPAGALGHAVASLFGADPKSELDADLLRFKIFMETGKAPRGAAAVTASGLGSAQSDAIVTEPRSVDS